MTYELLFHPDALDEWGKLDKPVREQFKKKLAERLLNPHIPASKLAGQKNRYKIKLRSMCIAWSMMNRPGFRGGHLV